MSKKEYRIKWDDATDEDILKILRSIGDAEFEYFIADLWERDDWDTKVTQQSRDQGIDVIANRTRPFDHNIVIQAKLYAEDNRIGSPEVQQYNSLKDQRDGFDEVVIVTTSSFTNPAKDLADSLRVKLVNGSHLVTQIRNLNQFGLIEAYLDNYKDVPPQLLIKADSSKDRTYERTKHRSRVYDVPLLHRLLKLRTPLVKKQNNVLLYTNLILPAMAGAIFISLFLISIITGQENRLFDTDVSSFLGFALFLLMIIGLWGVYTLPITGWILGIKKLSILVLVGFSISFSPLILVDSIESSNIIDFVFVLGLSTFGLACYGILIIFAKRIIHYDKEPQIKRRFIGNRRILRLLFMTYILYLPYWLYRSETVEICPRCDYEQNVGNKKCVNCDTPLDST